MSYFDFREELQKEIHSFKASWFLKWGITVVFIIIGIIIWFSSIVKYPDIITGQATLTSSTPPSTLIAMSTSQVKHIYFSDKDTVSKNDYLIEYEHSANLIDIKKIKKLLIDFNKNESYLIDLYEKLENSQFQLGEIENSYYEFINVLYSHYYYFKLKHDSIKINNLKEQKKIQLNLLKYYNEIIKIKDQELNLVNNKEKADLLLLQENIINKFSYDVSLENVLTKKSNVKNISILKENVVLQISKINEAITNYNLDRREKISQSYIGISSTYNNLLKSIELWEQKYTIRAPIAGNLMFLSFIKENNVVAAGERLFTIIPTNNNYEIQLKFPFEGAGKVKLQQQVKVKLSDIPYKEFGYLNCTIKNIAQVANEDHYLAIATPNNNLITTFNKQIGYKENMKGIGEIVTNDRSILGRMLEKIIYVFEN